MNSQNPLKNRILCLSLSAGIALLTGCATRPPREMGPPGKVQMPPSAPATDDLPPPVEVEVIPAGKEAIEREPAPPPKPKREPRAGTSYTIKKGESLSSIASRNKMSWKELAAYNHIANPDKVRVGQTILIPPSGSSKVSISPRREVAPPPAPPSGKTYVVQSGDNLSVIARRYGTNVKALKSANDLMSDRLLVGQVLKLPQGAETPERESRRSAEPEREPAAPRPTPIPMDVDDGMTEDVDDPCLLYTSPSPRDRQKSRMPSSA